MKLGKTIFQAKGALSLSQAEGRRVGGTLAHLSAVAGAATPLSGHTNRLSP